MKGFSLLVASVLVVIAVGVLVVAETRPSSGPRGAAITTVSCESSGLTGLRRIPQTSSWDPRRSSRWEPFGVVRFSPGGEASLPTRPSSWFNAIEERHDRTSHGTGHRPRSRRTRLRHGIDRGLEQRQLSARHRSIHLRFVALSGRAQWLPWRDRHHGSSLCADRRDRRSQDDDNTARVRRSDVSRGLITACHWPPRCHCA